MRSISLFLGRLDKYVSMTAKIISVFSLVMIFTLFILNVFVGFVPIYNFTQTDDWIQIFLVWMIFPGAMELVRTRNHFVVDVLTEKLYGTTVAKVCRILVTMIELATYLLICWFGWIWVMRAHATFQSIPWLEVRWAYAAIPVSAFFMSLYGARDFMNALSELFHHKHDEIR